MDKRISCWLLAVTLFISAALEGCQSRSSETKEKLYDVKASVTALDVDKKTVTLDHEAIPGLMQAMEMEFPVASPQVLAGIAVGDQVQAQLSVKSGEHIISRLEKR